MKKVFKFLTSGKFLLMLSLLINIAVFVLFAIFLGSIYYGIVSIVSFFVCLFLLSRSSESPAYKFTWLLAILIMPLFGTALYLYLKERRGTKKQRKNWQQTTVKNSELLDGESNAINQLKKSDSTSASIANYVTNTTNMPVYNNSSSTYLQNGRVYFDSLLQDLKNAKKFILLEYFIIKPGETWNSLFDILKSKAREGVEIRLLYDDFGCLDRFEDKKTFLKLNNHKIYSAPFNKIGFKFTQFSNYRDHRKIAIIDGECAYTGGINLADEYASNDTPFGIWKDAGIRITGNAVWNMTVMFLSNWELATKEKLDFNNYKIDYPKTNSTKGIGYVQPFGAGPLNPEPVHRNSYLKLINSATDELIMTTPYFILDNTIKDAIKVQAKAGVKVKLIMPGIPDKKYVFYLSRSYYDEFIKAGVEIYEFTPGFVHEKIMIADNRIACVGTINLDFRSLYLHYENGVMLYNSSTIADITNDINETLANSHLVTLRDVKHRKWYEKLIGGLIKLFAPLF